jgi:hypothetical protein
VEWAGLLTGPFRVIARSPERLRDDEAISNGNLLSINDEIASAEISTSQWQGSCSTTQKLRGR